MNFWWCNQAQGWVPEYTAGAVCSSAETSVPKYRETVLLASKGDIVLHYRKGHGIAAISRVKKDAIRYAKGDRRRICLYSRHGGGWAFETEYHLLTPPVPIAGILRKLLKLEISDGPVVKFNDGRVQVRQAYFMPISREALDIVIAAAPDRQWPAWASKGRASGKPYPVELPDTAINAEEGLAKEVNVIARKRSGKLRREALERAGGICEVCDRNFLKLLAGAGVRALQVHHKKQLSSLTVPKINTADDLAVLCANCHSLIHLDPKKAMTVPQLRRKLGRP
jgi:hypothetical protein